MKIALSSMPMGFCPECLTRLTNGATYEGVTLSDGTVVTHSYCEHREAGALGIIRPGKPVQWRITVPIDAVIWTKALPMRLASLAGGYKGLADGDSNLPAPRDSTERLRDS